MSIKRQLIQLGSVGAVAGAGATGWMAFSARGSLGSQAMNDILFENASALENATKLSVIVFDKTGTLTVGQSDGSLPLRMSNGATVTVGKWAAQAAGLRFTLVSHHPGFASGQAGGAVRHPCRTGK